MFRFRILICALLLISGASLENNKSGQLNFNFQQNEYKVNFEHADLVRYSKDYVQSVSIVTFKHNRTCTAFNISATFKVDLGNDLVVVTQSYRFASNEYRLFPMRFQFKLCDAFSKDLFGARRSMTCGNFSGCPLEKKKSFRICNFTPDASRFPPLIPDGRYMTEMQAMHFSNEVFVVRGYTEVTHPFTGK